MEKKKTSLRQVLQVKFDCRGLLQRLALPKTKTSCLVFFFGFRLSMYFQIIPFALTHKKKLKDQFLASFSSVLVKARCDLPFVEV
jgi:hypothetical protein